MKSQLIDISVVELREFINYTDEQYSLHLSDLSLVSLKLRLQFLISQNKQNNFYSFFQEFKRNKEFKENILLHILSQSNELFRDSDCWECFYKILQQCKKTDVFNICIFEFGNFSETITLLLFLEINYILHKTNITVIDTVNRSHTHLAFDFKEKEIETGGANFSKLSSSKNLGSFFSKKENAYRFTIPSYAKIQFVNAEKLKPNEQYDAVIARNLTLNYNFTGHQRMFQMYLNLMKKSGALFIGINENFDWCPGIESLVKVDPAKPLYIRAT